MIFECKNAFYLHSILAIGGIESHFYYMAQKYGKYDMTIFCRVGADEQLRRLRKFVRVVKISQGDKIVCTNLFCCFNHDILQQVEAKHYYMVLHGDYLDMVNRGQLMRSLVPVNSKFEKYLGVSQLVCDSWKKLTGINAELVGEPVVLGELIYKPMILVSATRLTAEKGWNRMKILADTLNKAEVKFLWIVFTNVKQTNIPKNMILQDPRLDVADLLPAFDAYVQLSDGEGFCLSVVEALKRGVPIIGTDLPVFHEIGLNETNSVLLPLDMSDIPLDKIQELIGKKINYTDPEDYWEKYLDHTPSEYTNDLIDIRATGEWQKMRMIDAELKHVPKIGETWTVTKERYAVIHQYEIDQKKHMVDVMDA